MTRQQCYHILELPPEANITEVKAAYRRLAKRWHPDRFAAHTAEQHQALERFYAITCAYQTLQATPTLPRPSPRQPAWLPHWCSKHWHTRWRWGLGLSGLLVLAGVLTYRTLSSPLSPLTLPSRPALAVSTPTPPAFILLWAPRRTSYAPYRGYLPGLRSVSGNTGDHGCISRPAG